MKKIFRTLLPLLLGGLIAGGVSAKELSGPAPDFTLKSNSGENIRLGELRGEVVLINFWASWCGPCRQEMPELEKLYQKYQKLGFTILGVNVEKDSAAGDRIADKAGLTFPVLYDTENQVSKQYKVSAMPSTVIVDRDGKQRFLHLGYKPGYEKDYEKQIKQLIRE